MTEFNSKPLQILNASAGSGKTYNLVLTYLKLILGEGRSAHTFAHIMAMTFTNKAALEMKTRIISALDLLSNPERSSGAETQKAAQYANSVAKVLNCSTEDLQVRAKMALKQILHQYEDFHVMTIDKFNLRLIRSFSRDLDLDGEFQVILNEDEVLDQVIDELMDGLDPQTRQQFTDLVLKYSREKVKDQEHWNFQRDLKSFATILTNEKYFSLLEEMKEADYSAEAYNALNIEIKAVESQIANKAKAVKDLFYSLQIANPKGGKNALSAFDKLTSDKLMQSSNKSGRFFTDTMHNYFASGEYPTPLAVKAIEFDDFYVKNVKHYHLLRLVRKNFFNMGLLQFIAEALENVKQTEKLIRISEFNKLISDLIEQEEAPFIYERLGNRFQHFLLDEFQDTSRLQWINIVPLVHESLSHNNENLIVGDPKQSIYRFKNGLAEQFVALPAIYNPEQDLETERKSRYFQSQGEKLPLKDNWRSRKDVVHFNNAFFKTFRSQIPEQLVTFYQDVEQIPKGKDGGFVFVHSEAIEDKEDNQSIPMMLTWIDQCIADGIEKGDICILGNTKKDCNAWAIELTSRGHKVVSADSLLVNSDHNVKMTMAYLRWRKNPAGELEARRFSELYFSARSDNSITDIRSYWKTETIAEGRTFQVFDNTKFFIEQFGSEENFFFPYENLFNLVQGFYVLAKLEEIHNPYLHHLSDMAHDFDNLRGPELEMFIDFYEKKGKDSAIQVPENKDAIKIMTGHKSKGLEFRVVLLPNMDWNIISKKSQFLIKDAGNIIYTTLSKSNQLDRVKEEYEYEFNQSFLDKINLCYVMFTRPIERLYIANYFAANPRDQRFGRKLHDVLQYLPVSMLNGSKEEKGNQAFTIEIGSPQAQTASESHENEPEELNFTPVSLSNRLWFPDISIQENALDEDTGLSEQQRFGNQIHLLLSLVNSENEIDARIHSLSESGEIETGFQERLKSELIKILSMHDYQQLLQGAVKILNEQGIIISATETKRPDKIILKKEETIVIDYKTGLPKAAHLKQVQLYADTLRDMGYVNVRGIVFYTGELRLVRAESVA